MRSCEDERPCQEAQVHYYDLLCQEEAAVPAVVRRHVAICPVCREKMRRLRETVLEAERTTGPAGAWQDETIEALAQQFQLLDERVTCSEVRPLLPELALESPQLRIPTPVTVHVDHCPQCAADLAALRELHLSAEQLKRLGRLLAAPRNVHLGNVEGVGTAAAMKRGRKTRATRGGLARTVSGSLSSEETAIACHDIAVADLFDCVVPSDSTPSGEGAARERQNAIARHVRSCPVCLRRMQTLQRTIGAIVTRGDSEVVTVYHAEKDAEVTGSEYPYPVSVQVLHSESKAVGDAHTPRTALATGLRKVGRAAKPLAALVLLGVTLTTLLRTTTPTASGTNLGDVDKTLAKMKHVYVVACDWQARPTEEFWIARSKILVHKTGENCVLYDLAHDRRRTLNLQTGACTSEQLSPDDGGLDGARRFMEGFLRRMVTQATPDTRLRPAEGQMPSGIDKGLDVYELRSAPQERNSSLDSIALAATGAKSPPASRWLVCIDPTWGLPRMIVSQRQTLGKDGWDPMKTTTTAFSYLTEQEMEESLQKLFPPE
ncbi:MAG: hypothetical protein M1376_24065 [Planctomycetes bacterium]|nr:hypothetical protein [Planctomycetota bacterium]